MPALFTSPCTFTGGESEYSIGPDVPILANAPGDMNLLKPGAAVFVIARCQTHQLHPSCGTE